MGLFGDDSDDDEKSFREEVEDIREAQEDDQQDSSSPGEADGGDSRSSEKLVEQAEGDIELKHLTETGGRVKSWLSDDPIIEYLDEDEQPEYTFTDTNKGLQYRNPDDTEGTIGGNSLSGAYFLVITDRQILYVAGSKGGDRTREWDYENIQTVGSDSGWVTSKLNFTDTDGTEYAFDVTDDLGEQEEAMAYIRKQIGKQTSDEKYLSDVSASDNPEVSTVNSEVSQASPVVSQADSDVQQWEYLTYRLDGSQNLDIVDAGLAERLTSGSSEYPLPPDEVLNQLGEQGWKLVETVEKSGREFGELASNEGSMTYAYIFRRPVSYASESDDESEESKVE